MNRHFVEMLRALSEAGVEFLIIGAHALAAHGYVRGTKDLDIWIRPTPSNAQRVWKALSAFGAPMDQLTEADLYTPGTIYQIGVDPARIDLLTAPAALDFDQAWANRIEVEVSEVKLPILGKADLIRTKRATGRPEDLFDIAKLEQLP